MKSLAEVHQTYLAEAYRLILPEAVLLGFSCILFLLAIVSPKRGIAFAVAACGLVAAALMAACLTFPSWGAPFGFLEKDLFWSYADGTDYHARNLSPFDPTGVACFVRFLALGFGAILLLLAWNETKDQHGPEYLGCQFVVLAGLSLAARANDLVSLYLALEMLSIPTYILLYLPAKTKTGQESAVKYFLLSVLSSGVMLFGFSYLYGVSGTTNLGAMVSILSEAHREQVGALALVGIVLALAGLCFRITAVPFHFYAPDVYQGGPTGVIAQLAFVPKVAGFIAIARLLGLLFPPLDHLPFDGNSTLIPMLIWLLAAITMTLGNVFALMQTNVRRMLAYSGVAHAGYMLMGFVVTSAMPEQSQSAIVNQVGLDSILFYLVAYGLMTIGGFAILAYLSQADRPAETTDDLAGLSQTHPLSAALMTLFLFSMIGLPLTAGFVGKLLLFIGLFDVPADSSMGNWPQILAAIAALNAAIAAVYYLRLVGVMYLRSPLQPLSTQGGRFSLFAAIICAVGTIALGIYPKPLVEATKQVVPYQDDRPLPQVALVP